MAISGNIPETWSNHNATYYAHLDCHYETAYNASANTSTVYVSPRYKPEVYYGGTSYFYNGSVDGNGVELKTMSSYQASDNISKYGPEDNTWNTLGTWSFTVQHNNSGAASFTVGFYCETANNANYSQSHIGRWGGTSAPISFSESRQLYVSYNGNGGSAPSATYFYGTTEGIYLSSTVPTRTGYTFAGWYTAASGGSYVGTAGTYIGTRSSSFTLYAHWTVNSYTVTCQDRVGNSSGALLGSSTTTRTYGSSISGSAWGSSATYNQYYTGYYYIGCTSATVNGNVTVYRYFAVNTYSLALTKSDSGITVNVSRVTSPYGGAQAGLLANGATLYYGDTLSISWAVTSGYMADTLEINSVDVSAETPPYPVTVSNSVSVVMTVKLGAIVYIANDLYQAFIWDGSNWVQYEAYIYNGSNWDAY